MRKLFVGISLGLASLLALSTAPSIGLELSGGRTFFSKSPRLLNVFTTYKETRIHVPTYYYTIDLPSQSGEPLQTISIQKRQGLELIRYYPDATLAFEGTPDDRGKALMVKTSQWDEAAEKMTITLDPPVPPGTTFTVGIKPIRNPEYSGIYLFGVTVFPSGENPMQMYLGNGRLDFFGSDSGRN